MPLVFRSLHQRKEASFGQDFLCLLEHELILRLLGVLYAQNVVLYPRSGKELLGYLSYPVLCHVVLRQLAHELDRVVATVRYHLRGNGLREVFAIAFHAGKLHGIKVASLILVSEQIAYLQVRLLHGIQPCGQHCLYPLTECVDGVSAQLERQFAIDGVRKSASLNLAQDYLKIEAGVLCHLQEFYGFYLSPLPKGKPLTTQK